MQIQFNRPVTLNKVTYGKGQHTVPDADAQGWFFDALVNAGDAEVLRGAESPAEAQETPAKGKRKAKEAAPVEAEAATEAAPDAEKAVEGE